MKKNLFILIFGFILLILPAQATDEDYSKAAGHTGVYVNTPTVWALKCKIKTSDLTSVNNALGWYTAWPMIVDYETGRFAQIGYITSPAHNINKPTFYVAWSPDGKDIKIRYLPHKKRVGNALYPYDIHEYAMSLNIDGTVNIQIDGIKYFYEDNNRININIIQGTGEFFAEASNLNMLISTEFMECYYKLRGDMDWRPLNADKKILLYYVAEGTTITPLENNSFTVQGKLESINTGKFFKEVLNSTLTNSAP